LFSFSAPSAVARDVLGLEDRRRFAVVDVSALLYDDRIFLFPSALWPSIVV
jgi:hypothetical protein